MRRSGDPRRAGSPGRPPGRNWLLTRLGKDGVARQGGTHPRASLASLRGRNMTLSSACRRGKRGWALREDGRDLRLGPGGGDETERARGQELAIASLPLPLPIAPL